MCHPKKSWTDEEKLCPELVVSFALKIGPSNFNFKPGSTSDKLFT